MQYDIKVFRIRYAESRKVGRCVRCHSRPALPGHVLCGYDRKKGLAYQRRRFKVRLRPAARQVTCSRCEGKGHNRSGCDVREPSS